jgi:hypothetical protein
MRFIRESRVKKIPGFTCFAGGLIAAWSLAILPVAAQHDHGKQPIKPMTSRSTSAKPHVGPLPPLPYEGYPSPRPMPMVQATYEFAARHPEVLQYIPCFCGCERGGHNSNHECFVRSRDPQGKVTWDSHGYGCAICIDVAYTSMQMFNTGASVAQIRTAIDQKYSSRFPTSTPTAKPPATRQ